MFRTRATRTVATAVAAVALMAGWAGIAKADALEDIKKKGVMVVGVKADYAPWGIRDSNGNIVGMEPDLAADIAKRIGVKVEFVPVVSSNRMQFLQQGKIDLMIATMSVTDERRKVVGIVDPLYYSAGVSVLARKSAAIKKWEDLKGKPVCAIQGAFYNKLVAEKYVQGDLVAFKGVPEIEQAMAAGRCIGWVYDDNLLIYLKATDKQFEDYEIVVESIENTPWGIAVKLEELNGPFGKLVSSAIADWHKTGFLVAEEKKWVGANSPWLLEQEKKAKGM